MHKKNFAKKKIWSEMFLLGIGEISQYRSFQNTMLVILMTASLILQICQMEIIDVIEDLN